MLGFFGGGAPEERRIDPEDGEARTFAELKELCKGTYSDAEINQYWETTCKPLPATGAPSGQQAASSQSPAPQAPQGAEQLHNVANDPFLTHTVSPAREPRAPPPGPPQPPGAPPEPPQEEGLANVVADPFLTEARFIESADVRQDPFLTHDERVSPAARQAYREGGHADRRKQIVDAAVAAQRSGVETVYRALGPGDPERKQSALNVLVFCPWVVFVWLLLVWLLLRHFSQDACAVLTAVLLAASVSMVLVWSQDKRWGPASLLVLGVLCTLAAVAGTVVGHVGWNQYWRQYWWMQTGHRFEHTMASTPAGARVDAAVIGFWDTDHSSTINGAAVDNLKSAGYKDVHYYCVAPIIDPEQAAGSLIRVNYWAIGIDCCQRLGSFTCDDSRESDGAYGVVMLDGGYPCPGCNVDKFRDAVTKAEAMHGLVSATGAMYVRWVRTAGSVSTTLLLKALAFMLLSILLSLLAAFVLGYAAWYYGLGKRPLSLLDAARDRQKQLA